MKTLESDAGDAIRRLIDAVKIAERAGEPGADEWVLIKREDWKTIRKVVKACKPFERSGVGAEVYHDLRYIEAQELSGEPVKDLPEATISISYTVNGVRPARLPDRIIRALRLDGIEARFRQVGKHWAAAVGGAGGSGANSSGGEGTSLSVPPGQGGGGGGEPLAGHECEFTRRHSQAGGERIMRCWYGACDRRQRQRRTQGDVWTEVAEPVTT